LFPEVLLLAGLYYNSSSVTDHKPTSLIVIDSTVVDPTALTTLETELYGAAATPAKLPLPDAVIAMFDVP
jgi:hypothetical protein